MPYVRLSKRRKVSAFPKRSILYDFKLGYVAQVERVWSIAKHLLGAESSKSLPLPIDNHVTVVASTRASELSCNPMDDSEAATFVMVDDSVKILEF